MTAKGTCCGKRGKRKETDRRASIPTTAANRFGYAGEQYDPVSGLYYLRARFYKPVIGRFIQEDTYYGDGLNLYSYCRNNPVGYVDPSGHKKTCPIVADIMNQLGEANFSKEAIKKLEANLKGRWKKTKQALLDKINAANGDVNKLQSIIEEHYRGSKGSGKTRWQYIKEWHDKKVKELFGNNENGRTRSKPNNTFRRFYDSFYKGYDIEYKSDNFSKGPRTKKELNHIKSQIEKDIYFKEKGLSNPYWHFQHDPTIAQK